MDKIAPTTRHKYRYQGRTVYEWEQRIGDVTIYIDLPPGVKAKQLEVSIKPRHLTVGVKGLPPYMDYDLGGGVIPSDSLWTIEDGELTIHLSKASNAALWASALAGHEGDEAEAAEDRRRLMLERFQQDHPGFDFSGAQFNGDVPDPETFLRDLGDSGAP